MDRLGIFRTLVMAPPEPPDFANSYDYDAFLSAIRVHRDRIEFLGGGGTLNPLIQRWAAERDMPDPARADFEKTAERILAAGAAGFGEISCHHVSYEPGHPFEQAAPDAAPLLLLADIAGRTGVPIDMHMDAVLRDMPTPQFLRSRSPLNPDSLVANVERFERLLAHNRDARIVWAHAGSDVIGDWTVVLSRTLLGRHSNLT